MTSLLTNPYLRSWSRRFHLIKILSVFHSWWKRWRGIDYEESFWNALQQCVRPGDVVWDVGANVGHYSTRLASLVGESGKVAAFEPFPATAEILKRATTGFPNIHLFNCGLGDEDMKLDVPVGGQSEINSLVRPAGSGTSSGAFASIQIRCGDAVLTEHPDLAPNVIKIDVEGYEEEVLTGLSKTLQGRDLRGIFIEVHFGILEDKGQRQAPLRICDLLVKNGFKVTWTDYSHIQAIAAR